MRPQSLVESCNEVKDWLSYADLDEHLFKFLDDGYDDLEAISRANERELGILQKVVPEGSAQRKLEALVKHLQKVGIDAFRLDPDSFGKGFRAVGSGGRPETPTDEPSAMDDYEASESRIKSGDSDEEEHSKGGELKDVEEDAGDDKVTELISIPKKGIALELDLHRIQKVEKDGYLSVKGPLVGHDDWTDLFFVRKSGILQWKQSRKLDFIGSIDLSNDRIRLQQTADLTVMISVGIDGPPLFIEFESSEVLKTWLPTIVYESDDSGRSSLLSSELSTSLLSPINGKAVPHTSKSFSAAKGGAPKERSATTSGTSLPAAAAPVSPLTEFLADGEPSMSAPSSSGVSLSAAMGSGEHFKVTTLPVLISEFSTARRSLLDDKSNQKLLEIILEGAIFKKYKKGSSVKRLVYCSPDLSKLGWASTSDRRDVQGFIKTKEIFDIEAGTGKNKQKIYVVSRTRVLEIETPDTEVLANWMKSLKLLVELSKLEQEDEKVKLSKPDYAKAYDRIRNNFKLYLVKGEIFRMLSKGSSVVRHVYCTQDMENLVWKDVDKMKYKGSLPIGDIMLLLSEKSKNDNKFVIVAKKKVIVLEAKDRENKEKFMEALSFWIK